MTEANQRAAELNSVRVNRLRRAAAYLDLCPYVRSVLCRLYQTVSFAHVVQTLGTLENLFSLYLIVRGFGPAMELLLNWANAHMPEGKKATPDTCLDEECLCAADAAGFTFRWSESSRYRESMRKEQEQDGARLTLFDYRYRAAVVSTLHVFRAYDASQAELIECRRKLWNDLFNNHLVRASFVQELDSKLAYMDLLCQPYAHARWDTVPDKLMHRMPAEVMTTLPTPEETIRRVPDLVTGMEVVSYLLERPWDPCSLIIDAHDLQRLWTLRQQDALIVLKEQMFARMGFARSECLVRELCEGLRQSDEWKGHESHALGWDIIEDLIQLGCCASTGEQYRMLLNRIMRRLLLLNTLNYGDDKSSELRRRISTDPELLGAWADGCLCSTAIGDKSSIYH